SAHLKHVEIDNQYEVAFDPVTGHTTYSVWIHEEDKIDRAKSVYDDFVQNPSDPRFDPPIVNETEEAPKEQTHFKTYITYFFLFLCAMVYFINATQEFPIEKSLKDTEFVMTSIQATLMFDLPPAFSDIEQLLEKHALSEI